MVIGLERYVFWDNYGNAQWQKSSRSRNSDSIVIIRKIVDLTDKNHLDRLNTAFKKLKTRVKSN